MEFALLVKGKGDYSQGTASVVSAAVARQRLAAGEPLGEATNDMPCACPVLRTALVCANDANWWRDDEERTLVLSPWINRLAESRDGTKTMGRALFLLNGAVLVDLPDALRCIGLRDQITNLRRLVEISDLPTAMQAAYMSRDAYTKITDNSSVASHKSAPASAEAAFSAWHAIARASALMDNQCKDPVVEDVAAKSAAVAWHATKAGADIRTIRDRFLSRLQTMLG